MSLQVSEGCLGSRPWVGQATLQLLHSFPKSSTGAAPSTSLSTLVSPTLLLSLMCLPRREAWGGLACSTLLKDARFLWYSPGSRPTGDFSWDCLVLAGCSVGCCGDCSDKI